MIKREELSSQTSCLNRANEDEMLFVLLGRDPAAPVAIRAWIEERIRLGKNKRLDRQLLEAETCAVESERQQKRTEEILAPLWSGDAPGSTCAPTGCNRHVSCAAFDAKWLADHPKETMVPLNLHCFNECCEDCFGQ